LASIIIIIIIISGRGEMIGALRAAGLL